MSAQVDTIVRIPVANIDPNPYQQRKTFDSTYIDELAQSIKANGGLISPISVRPHPTAEGRFQLIAGECRTRAHQRLQWTEIQAIVRPGTTDVQMEEQALVENTKRQDLLPMEEASGYQRLLENNGNNLDLVAEKTGTSRVTIEKRVALLDLQADVQAMVDKRQITLEMAEVLLGVEDPEQQKQLATVALQARFDLNRLKGIVNNTKPTGGNGQQNPTTGDQTGPKPVRFKDVNKSLVGLNDQLERLDVTKLSAEDARTLEAQLSAIVHHISEDVMPRVSERRTRAEAAERNQQAQAAAVA